MNKIKEIGNLKRIYLGGTGDMYLVKGGDRDYLYKPAISKYSRVNEPFRAFVQECAYEVQKIVDPESAVMCYCVEFKNGSGSLQERIMVDKNAPNYGLIQEEGKIAKLSKKEIDQFMREFVTDYLLYNFDSHGRNFITDKNGIIRGVDKEQSFRYIDDKDAQNLSIDYSPNTVIYGELEPIYNTIFRAYQLGSIDIDFEVIDKYIKRVEKIDNKSYSNIFVPYCEACAKAFNQNPQEKLLKILDRKINIRENITAFFNELITKRQNNIGSGKGKKFYV